MNSKYCSHNQSTWNQKDPSSIRVTALETKNDPTASTNSS